MNLDEAEARIIALESKISGAVRIPTGAIDINDNKITNKQGFCCFGIRQGINNGKLFVAVSNVADPQTDLDFQSPFIFKSI